MKIAYVVTRSDAIGGVQVHIRDLASALLSRGHDVLVLVGGQGPYLQELAGRNIPFRPIPHLVRPIDPRQDVRAFWEIRAALQRFRPDLLSTHSSKAAWLGRLVARTLGIPAIRTAAGWNFTDGVPERAARIYRWAEWIAARYSHRIITVSEYDRELALRERIAPPEKLIAIHNGMPDVASDMRARPHVEPPRLVMVARFEAQKDHATLLRALASLQALPWSLDLIGDGPLRPQIEELAQQLGITERVRLLGARRDIAEQLAAAQLFVLASNWEGFPRTVLEAMRAGLPVIASDVGGTRESVVDGETGFLVSRGDVAGWVGHLKALIDDSQLRARFGAAARQRYEERFRFEHMLGKTWGVYEAVLAEVDARSVPPSQVEDGV